MILKQIRFYILFLVFSFNVIADSSCLLESLEHQVAKKSYHVLNSKGVKNKLSFSYEIEYNLKETPNLVKYYKVKGFKDSDWIKLSESERLELAIKKHATTSSQNSVVLVKLETAPDFLPKKIVKESSVNLEMVDNPISGDLNLINKNIDWIWENIGAGSIQGHVAFDKKNVVLHKVDQAVKLDYDISQAQSFVKGYSAYIQDNSKLPGSNINHHSLGPVDALTLKKIRENTNSKLKTQLSYDRNLKFIYGQAYRGDLYGSNKVGFEIRNCHKRKDCFKLKMQQLSDDLETNFSIYHYIPESDVISGKKLNEISDDIQDIYRKAGKVQSNVNSPYVSGSSYELRYLYPHLDWTNHPLITVLPKQKLKDFKMKYKKYFNEYEKEVRKLKDMSSEEYPKQLQIITSRWAHNIGIDKYLEEGMLLIRDLNNRNYIEHFNLKLTKSKNIHEHDYELLNNSLKQVAIVHGEGKELNNYVKGIKELDPESIGELSHFIRNPIWAKSFGDFSLNADPETIASLLQQSSSKADFLNTFSNLTSKSEKKLLKILKETGLHTSIGTPYGRWVFDKISENGPEFVEMLMKASEELKLTDAEIGNILKATSIKKFPNKFNTDLSFAKHVLSLLSDRKNEKTFKWLSKELDTIKVTSNDELEFFQVLLVETADKMQAIDSKHFLVKLGENEFVVKASNKKSSPFSFTRAEDFGRGRIDSLVEARINKLSKGKMKVSNLDFLSIIKKNPDSVFVISATSIHHQGLVIGDMVYSVVSDKGVTKLPLENWISKWGNSTLVELNVNKKTKKKIFDSIEAEIGKPVNFKIKAEDGFINCTNMVSCHIEKADVIEFPNQYVRSDSKGQINYLQEQLIKDDMIKAVYIRNKYLIDPSIKNKIIAGSIVFGVASAYGYFIYSLLEEDE